MSIDHILVIAFGGPPRAEDVRPFLEIVTRGIPIPKARIDDVAHHYAVTGGYSPYNEHTQRLYDRVVAGLHAAGVTAPIFLGMRNWNPFFKDVVREINAQGLRSGLGVILAPHRCDASFEKYLRNVEDAKAANDAGHITYEYLKPWHTHPLFIQAQAAFAQRRLDEVPPAERAATHLLFTAHSVPMEQARRSRYAEEFAESSRAVARELKHDAWSLAYQSRSGPPSQPWLEPDVNDALNRANDC